MDARKEYRRLRALGWTASAAARAARINTAFDDAESVGLVELRVVADDEQYDAGYVDSWGLPDVRADRIKRELFWRIDAEGCTGIVTRARQACGEMYDVDSVWGFVGEDWRDSGYDVDVKAGALDVAGIDWKAVSL